MISFIHLSALLGLLALLAPVLIHLMRQRRNVLTVPSLLLFTTLRKIKMRRRLRDLLLLALRIAACVLLALFLSRPELKIRQPEIGAGAGQAVLLGLLIDNSPSSQASVGGKTFLELAKKRALARISVLPPGSMVLLSFTAGGLCSAPLSPERASSLLKKLSFAPLPARPGAALAALQRERLRVAELSWGRIIVLVPPFEGLLRDVAEALPEEQKEILLMEQLAEAANSPDPWIDEVDINPERLGELEVVLGGAADTLAEAALVLSNGNDILAEFKVSMEDAHSGRIRVPLESNPGGDKLSLCLKSPMGLGEGPLASYFYSSSARLAARNDVLILYENSPDSLLAAQVFWAALQAVAPQDSSVRAINCSSKPETLQTSAKTLVLASLSSSANVDKWLSECIDSASVLFVAAPLSGGELNFSSIPKNLSPCFGPLQTLPKPLRLELANNPNLESKLLRSYAKGFNKAEIQSIQGVKLLASDQAILKYGNETLVALGEMPQGASMILWGIPVQGPFAARFLANPLLPQFLGSLLLSQSAKQLKLRSGMMINLSRQLGFPQAHGEVLCPDGKKIELAWDLSHEERIYLLDAGFYKFKLIPSTKNTTRSDKTQDFAIAVNVPRSCTGAFLDEKRIAELLPCSGGFIASTAPISYLRFSKAKASEPSD